MQARTPTPSAVRCIATVMRGAIPVHSAGKNTRIRKAPKWVVKSPRWRRAE